MKVQIHIALIQEPWIYRGMVKGLSNLGTLYVREHEDRTRSCIVTRGVQATLLNGLCYGDVTTVRVLYMDGNGENRTLVICSAYFLHDDSNVPSLKVRETIRFCNRENMELIIGCDANAHHEVWGSTDTNERRSTLLKYLLGTELCILNQGSESTFVISSRAEVLDLTLDSCTLASRIRKWRVLKKASMSV